MKLNNGTKAFLLILTIILIDQCLKFWIKLNMSYSEDFLILGQEWARIHFVENEGMAFGFKYGGATGKIVLSLFRLTFFFFLVWVLRRLIKNHVRWGIIAGLSLILAGALGNIIDSLFYGLIFSESYVGKVASFMPDGGGYAGFLMGKVVDMFYFPLIDTVLPEWVPFLGGKPFVFFRPIFNVADSAITIGILYMLIFQRSFFKNQDNVKW